MGTPVRQRLFDRAVARFNNHRFFEAHEDWEVLWHDADGARRRWLQGLIQVAAAFVHFERGYAPTGFVKLIREGLAKALPFPDAPCGLSARAFEASLEPWREHAERVAAGAPLREDAPSAPPRLVYAEDVRADPLPEDVEAPDEF